MTAPRPAAAAPSRQLPRGAPPPPRPRASRVWTHRAARAAGASHGPARAPVGAGRGCAFETRARLRRVGNPATPDPPRDVLPRRRRRDAGRPRPQARGRRPEETGSDSAWSVRPGGVRRPLSGTLVAEMRFFLFLQEKLDLFLGCTERRQPEGFPAAASPLSRPPPVSPPARPSPSDPIPRPTPSVPSPACPQPPTCPRLPPPLAPSPPSVPSPACPFCFSRSVPCEFGGAPGRLPLCDPPPDLLASWGPLGRTRGGAGGWGGP